MTEPERRDVTRSLEIVRELRAQEARATVRTPLLLSRLDELLQILTDMDARTGRRDPLTRDRRAR